MYRYLLIYILGIFVSQCGSLSALGDSHGDVKRNLEFHPFIATERLNDDYHYALLYADETRKIYFFQSIPRSSGKYPDSNMLGIYHGEGSILDGQLIARETLLTLHNTRFLSLFYPFYPSGSDMEVQSLHTVARECAIHILPKATHALVYLDQRFSTGGTGGMHDGILRKYLVITREHLYIATGSHIVTYFSLGYPRDSGTKSTWKPGSMRYSHCYRATATLAEPRLTVTCANQEFVIEHLFERPELVQNSVHAPPNGWWGEYFTYKDFQVPREPRYKYAQETITFSLNPIE